jgi:ribosomal-protein-alanine N-acetyltransferase
MLENTFFCLPGSRVSLFPFEETELNSSLYLKWMNDKENVKTIGRNDYLLPVNIEKLRAYVQGLDRSKTAFFGIYFSDSQASQEKSKMSFVGTLKIYDIDFESRKASIGIMVGERNLWGKGIASEAISISCDYCFKTLNFHKVCAGYFQTNTGMEKAFAKNGFEVEGVLKEHFFDLEKFQNVVLVAKMRKA